MTQKSRGNGLVRKIGRPFFVMMVLWGLLVVGVVYTMTGQALYGRLEHRVSTLAINLSDTAAGALMGAKSLELHALAMKYSRLEGVAYAFIENGKHEILAYSPGSSPAELKTFVKHDDLRHVVSQQASVRGRPVYEVRAPVLEGQLGAAHVGMWLDLFEQEMSQELLPLILLIAVVLLAGVLSSILLTKRLVRPIAGLTELAMNMSRGDLDTPVGTKARDEMGELARSLERMRASLRAAMTRLSGE